MSNTILNIYSRFLIALPDLVIHRFCHPFQPKILYIFANKTHLQQLFFARFLKLFLYFKFCLFVIFGVSKYPNKICLICSTFCFISHSYFLFLRNLAKFHNIFSKYLPNSVIFILYLKF